MNARLSKGLILVASTLALLGCSKKASTVTTIKELKLSETEITLSAASQTTPKQLTATIVLEPEDGSIKDYVVVWTSDNDCATVDQDGKVSANHAGVANIKATSHYDNSKYAICVVTVI